MIVEKVYSPIRDNGIKRSNHDLVNSKIWDKCFKEEEVTTELKEQYGTLYEYSIKFENTTPIQVTKVKTIKAKKK